MSIDQMIAAVVLWITFITMSIASTSNSWKTDAQCKSMTVSSRVVPADVQKLNGEYVVTESHAVSVYRCVE